MLLFPTILSKTAKDLNEHPFMSLGIIQSKDTSYGVTYVKYFGLLLQEISLEMGEELLRRILSFVNLSILSADASSIVSKEYLQIQKFEAGRDSSDLLFFEFFQMHPIKINLTFSRTEESDDAPKKT
jgi:vacuolar protein sorting-associated protein 13A/C